MRKDKDDSKTLRKGAVLIKMKNTEVKTIGEVRVRTSFNPSNDGTVDQIKQKSAELINLLQGIKNGDAVEPENVNLSPEQYREKMGEKHRLIALAQTAYEEAAMWSVKAATA